ncbi:hypothetical protein UlMin_013244 [Ulmus minor]
MGVDAEDILVCFWRFLRFFINVTQICLQNHPFVSGIFLLFFLVYVFFDLLIYHSPFLIFIVVLLRFFWSSETTTIQNVKEKEENNQRVSLEISKDDRVIRNKDLSSFEKQKSRRTNVKEKNIEWKAPQKIVVDQEQPSSSSAENVQLDPPKPITESNSKPELALDDQIEEAEEEDEEDGGNKAVEWTEDDQKNLMDLGLSEIERNKRLESLIAKRRARKLFRMQVEKALVESKTNPPSQIAPIFVARTNPFDVPTVSNDIDSMQIPGSAPSVLLPTQNPFDLPYDPLEEKPNLMADSFQQEFAAANQKELMYCRHESFCLGPFQFNSEQERRETKMGPFFVSEKRGLEGFGCPRYRRQSGDHDRLIEQLLLEVRGNQSHIDRTPATAEESTEEENTETNTYTNDSNNTNDIITANRMESISSTITEVDLDPPATEDSNDESTSSSSSEVANRSDVSNKLFSHSVPNMFDPLYEASTPTGNNKNGMEERMFYVDKTTIHTPTFSIASDLQVEVSEVGSPPLTVNGNNSPNDGESLSYDGELGRVNSTNFDQKSLEDINRVMEEVGKLRDSCSFDGLSMENQEKAMELMEKLPSRSFSEGVSEKTEENPDESMKEVNAAKHVVADTNQDKEDQEKQEEAIPGDLPKPVEETELESSSNMHIEGNSLKLEEHRSLESMEPLKDEDQDLSSKGDDVQDSNYKGDEKLIEQESITNISNPREAENNFTPIENKSEEIVAESEISPIYQSSDGIISRQVSIAVEEVPGNLSSPSSPTSTLIQNIPDNEDSSSNLHQDPESNVEDHQMNNSRDENLSSDDSSATKMLIDEANKAGTEELKSSKAMEIGSISNDDIIDTISEKLAEESTNPTTTTTKELNDPEVSDEKEKEEDYELKGIEASEVRTILCKKVENDNRKYHKKIKKKKTSRLSLSRHQET